MKDLVLGDLDRKVNASAVISASLILTLVLLVTHIPCSNLCGTGRHGMGKNTRVQTPY